MTINALTKAPPMRNEAQAWQLEVKGSTVETQGAPSDVILRAVGILFTRADASGQSQVRRDHSIWLLNDILPPRLNSSLTSWASRWLRRGETSSDIEEADPVKTDEEARQRDLDNEQQLERIMSNPELAERAFPNPVLRKIIVPLLADVRKLTERSGEEQ
jgi:hypothetical protein